METKVQVKIDNSVTDISEDIYNAVRYLNNFFALEKIDDSLVTVADQNYIELTDVLDVELCYIDGEQIEKIKPEEFYNIPRYEDYGVQRFYFLDNKLYFTVAPSEDDIEVKILQKYRFNLPATTVAFDVPAELLQLVELGAISNYYTNLISTTAQNRENLSDVQIDEVRRAKNIIDKELNSKLDNLRNNSVYAL